MIRKRTQSMTRDYPHCCTYGSVLSDSQNRKYWTWKKSEEKTKEVHIMPPAKLWLYSISLPLVNRKQTVCPNYSQRHGKMERVPCSTVHIFYCLKLNISLTLSEVYQKTKDSLIQTMGNVPHKPCHHDSKHREEVGLVLLPKRQLHCHFISLLVLLPAPLQSVFKGFQFSLLSSFLFFQSGIGFCFFNLRCFLLHFLARCITFHWNLIFTYFIAWQFPFYSFTRASKFNLLVTIKGAFTRMTHLFASMATGKLLGALVFATTEEVLFIYISCGYFLTFHIEECDLAVTSEFKHLNTRRACFRMTGQNTRMRTTLRPWLRASFFTLKAFLASLIFATTANNFSHFVALFHTCMILTVQHSSTRSLARIGSYSMAW